MHSKPRNTAVDALPLVHSYRWLGQAFAQAIELEVMLAQRKKEADRASPESSQRIAAEVPGRAA